MPGFGDFAPIGEAKPLGFADFKPDPTWAENILSAGKAVGGELASISDFVLGFPGFAASVTANLGTTIGTAAAGATREEAWKAGREAMEKIPEFARSPMYSLLKMFDSEQIYEDALTTQGMQKISSKIQEAGKWIEKKSGGSIPAESMETLADTLMLELGPMGVRGAKAAKAWMARKAPPKVDPGIGSEIGGMPKPRLKGPPAVVQEAPKFEDFVPAGKPRIKPKVAGEVDPELLGWLATGAALTTAGGLVYSEYKRSGRDILDIIRDPRGPVRAPAEEEPQPTESSTFLSKVPEWLVGGAMLAGAVRTKGVGSWHPDTPKRLAAPLKLSLTRGAEQRLEYNDPAIGEASGIRTHPTDLAAENWADSRVRTYLNRWAATKEDPLGDIRIPLRDTDIRWEDAWDQAIHSREARTMTDVPKGTPPTEQVWDLAPRYRDAISSAQGAITSYLSHVGDYLRQSVPPEKLQQYDLVRAVKETAEADKRAAAAMEKASAASMKDMPVHKAYPDGYKWVELKLPEKLTEEQAKFVRPATADEARLDQVTHLTEAEALAHKQGINLKRYVALGADGKPIKNSYTGDIAMARTPKEAHLAGQLAQEGNIMGHCVGGYCAGVASGESRIFSLRDPKGRSHVTVEVQSSGKTRPRQLGSLKDILIGKMEDIVQIKGKQNRAPLPEYLPYVQDFVKSGKWGEVGDLQNTGLVNIADRLYRGAATERSALAQTQVAALSKRFEGQRYVSKEDWEKAISDTGGLGAGGFQRGAASPELLKHLAALGLGAAAGSYLSSDHPAYGAVIGAIAGLSLTALRRPNTLLERELRQSVEQAIRAVSPESLGPEAKQAAALIAKAISERMQKNSAIYHSSEGRRRYWDKHSDQQTPFIKGFERGWTPKDPALKAITTFYREWADRIFKQDTKLGIEYEQRDNYLYHVFEDGDKVAQFFETKYSAKWGDPRFSKARGFDLYDEAIKAGYKPRTTNPEEIMLMRQFASNVAEMRINALRDMEKYGLARTVKGNTRELGDVQWRSPNGDLYWVHEHAAQILHNAFDTPSLWNMKGALGSGFRAAMYTKNTLVPVILNLSLFHPLHLSLGMDNSAAMLRASKELVAGTSTPAQYIGRMARYGNPITAIFDSVWTNPKAGWRPFKLWKGQIPEAALTEADKLILQYTHEGGFVPEMSKEYRTGAIESFKKAWDQNNLTAIPKFALAVPQWLQKPLFEYWIPSLKYASYLNDVKTALKTNPALLDDPVARGVAFRKLAKSVENRYGEMAYDTLFWNRLIRDLGVANTLSLGWSLGFFREYGGAISEAGQASVKLDLKGRVARGELDRAMFVAMYTTNTALYGGLLTWALTGKPPTQWMDYFYPRTGDKNPDGSDARVNTMFYSRELLGMWKHAQNEGVLPGISQFLTNKLAPTWGIAKGLWTNLDFMGREISDPNSSAFKQLAQKVGWAVQEITPISIQSIRKSPEITPKTVALGVTGFAPAPRYATETPVEGKIAAVFRQYHKSTTPYERARYSEEVSELYKLRQKGDTDKFYDKLQELREKHHLTHEQVRRIRRESQIPGTERMFRALTETQQEQLLKGMSPEDREKYSRLAHRKLKRKLRMEQ